MSQFYYIKVGFDGVYLHGHVLLMFLFTAFGHLKHHCCELCQQTFTEPKLLTSHYKLKHKVTLGAGKANKKNQAVILTETAVEQAKNEENQMDTGLDAENSSSNDVSHKEMVNYDENPADDINSVRKVIVIAPELNTDAFIKADEIVEQDFIKTVIFRNSVDEVSNVIQNHIGNDVTDNCTVISDSPVVKEYSAIKISNTVEKNENSEGNITLENMTVGSDNEENTLVVNLHDEVVNHNNEISYVGVKEGGHFNAVGASPAELHHNMPTTDDSNVKVEPAVTFVIHKNGTFHFNTIPDKQTGIPVNLIPASADMIKHVDPSTVIVASGEPDFHFISNIGIVKGQSLCYGKHEFKCLHCAFKTQWRNTLCLHMKEKHAALIGSGKQLEVNIPPHRDGGKILRMSEYIEMQKKKMKVKTVRGVETQDLPGDFPCNVCGKVYHRLRYLRCHMKLHNQSADLLCSECGKAFKTKAYLAQHLRSHRVKEMYQCSQCEFRSDSNTLIHAHIQIHSDGCLICDICNAAFTDKTTLQRHKRVHDKSRPFGCSFEGCTMRFKTEMMCNGHYKQHFTKGKFECSVCGYVFRQKHHLVRHRKHIHNLYLNEDINISENHISENHNTTDSSIDSHKPFDSPLKIDEMTGSNSIETLESHTLENLESNSMGTLESNGMETLESNSMEANNDTDQVIQANEEQYDLDSALQPGELVVATDEDGNPVTYKISDINVNTAFQSILQVGEGENLDPHTILIPQADANNVVFEDAIETVGT